MATIINDDLSDVIRLKEQADETFKNKQYEKAFTNYYVEGYKILKTKKYHDIGKRDQLLLTLSANIAQCLIEIAKETSDENVKSENYIKCHVYCNEALDLCNEHVNNNKIKEKCLYRSGIAYIGCGDYDSAITYFKSVLEINPNNTAAIEKLNQSIKMNKLPKEKVKENDFFYNQRLIQKENPFKIEDADAATKLSEELIKDMGFSATVKFSKSTAKIDWYYYFLSEGYSKLLETTFPSHKESDKDLFPILEEINYGGFSRAQNFLNEHYPEYNKFQNNNVSQLAKDKILFHAIIQRHLGNTEVALKLLQSSDRLFSKDEEFEYSLYVLEKVLCFQANSTESYTVETVNILLEQVLTLTTLDPEIHFDVRLLKAREYNLRQQKDKAYEYIMSFDYIGNPLYKAEFWLLLTELHRYFKRSVFSSKCLTLSSFSVFEMESTLSLLMYYKNFALCCAENGHFAAPERDGENFKKILGVKLHQTVNETAPLAIKLYHEKVAEIIDVFESIFLELYKSHASRDNLDSDFINQLAWKALRWSDYRITLGWYPELNLINKIIKPALKTLNIPEYHAFISFFLNKSYYEGQVMYQVVFKDTYKLFTTNIWMKNKDLCKCLDPVLDKISGKHFRFYSDFPSNEFPWTVESLKIEYNDIYLTFIQSIEDYLSKNKIYRLKLVLHEDFCSKILVGKQREAYQEQLELPKNACYIEYSTRRLFDSQIVSYVVFPNKTAYIKIINLQNGHENFIKDITYLTVDDDSSSSLDQKHSEKILEELYTILFKPLIDVLKQHNIEKIKIIPEGELQNIPFLSLIVEKGCYLIDIFEISIIPSIEFDQFVLTYEVFDNQQVEKVALFTTTNIDPNIEKEYALYDDDDKPIKLSDFVESIPGEIYSESNLKTTKEDLDLFFNDKKSNYTVFHWCGHTQYNHKRSDQNNDYSISGCLITEYTNKDKSVENFTHDTLLYSSDIIENYNLTHLKLAFLNSCNSYKARKTTRSGHLGLTRAFYAAGIPCVIATLVSVFDESKDFSDFFYEQIMKEHSISTSFTNAIRKLKKKTGDGHEHWSYYVLFGNGELKLNFIDSTK
ncbi:unnamed protein product [Rotaria magnacalcarata]